MKLIEESFMELFPSKNFTYSSRIRYSRAFKGYNANIKLYTHKNEIVVSLSKKWNTVSKDIKKGLIQELLLKLFAGERERKTKTLSIDLYHIFLKNTHRSAEKNLSDPVLEESFNRVNNRYFNGMLDMTNLVWGNFSRSVLGRYDYGTDTIMVSRIFENSPERFIDRVMHHEMLHKKHKYTTKNGRHHHHTPKFRSDEKLFEDFDKVESEIKDFIHKETFIGIPKRVNNSKNSFFKFLGMRK
ncbi:MAG: SprT-like domain-containing protein [Nanoarchaeota archaeon]